MRRKKTEEKIRNSTIPCSWEGCLSEASFKAPKSKTSIGSNKEDDYHFFCSDHIGEYNKNWNFFEGMSEYEINSFRHDALTGHLPTWDRETRKSSKRFTTADITEALARFRGANHSTKTVKPARRLTEAQKEALAVMDMPLESSAKEIKQRYKALVKQLHPDVNYGDKQSEERFKRVAEAYKTLQDLK